MLRQFFFKEALKWDNCIGVCTDREKAMVRKTVCRFAN